MTYNREIHHRRSIRLKEYDYSQAGAYFVTVCAWKKECLFGEIKNGEMLLNEYDEIVMKCWNDLPHRYYYAQLDEFVIMPNHVHGIVSLSNVGAQFIAPFRTTTMEKQGVIKKGVINIAPTENNSVKQGEMNHAPTVGDIVRGFKARCTHAINKIRNSTAVPVWQRNYYEHIIREDQELYAIREYIRYNPLKWDEDEENQERNGQVQTSPPHN
jgi:REP element-mobilizing transposase RayT